MEIPDYIRRNSVATITISGSVEPKLEEKAVWEGLFSNYDIRFVHVNDHRFINEYIIGRGSHAALKLTSFYLLDKNMSPLLEVGRMCNFAKDSTILVDGEHTNKEVINVVFTQFPCNYARLRRANKIITPLTTKGKTTIGNAVLVCKGATILSGITIGDGAVIGANALVTKDVPPFSIVVGNPAKIISCRFDAESIKELLRIRWWDFELEYLFSNLWNIQNMKVGQFIENFGDITKNKYVTNRNRFVCSIAELNANERKTKFIGCDLDGKYVPFDKLSETLQFYIKQLVPNQLSKGKEFYVVNNIFDCQACDGK